MRKGIFTLLAELKACARSGDLQKARKLHAAVVESGEDSDIFVASSLVDMFAKCGSIGDAHQIFDRISHQDTIAWNALISGYAENRDGKTALELFSRMEGACIPPDALTFVAVLKACTDLAAKEEAKLIDGRLVKMASRERGMLIHSKISKHCFESHIFVANSLVNMYAKVGSLEMARHIFENIKRRDVVTWNALIFGYVNNGEGEQALDLISRMEGEGCVPNERTFVAAVKACSDLVTKEECVKVDGQFVKVRSLEKLKLIHQQAVKAGVNSYTHFMSAVVDMYAKCGSLRDARKALEEAQTPEVASWNALLFGYVENGESIMAVELFERMQLEGCTPNALTFVAAIKACSSLTLEEADPVFRTKGLAIHVHASNCGCDRDFRVANSLVDMYAKFGNMVQAQIVFDSMHDHDVISWTSLIMGYVANGEMNKALELFSRMEREGLTPDMISWNALICGFAEYGEAEKALELYSQLERRGFAYNTSSFVGALKACIDLAANEEPTNVGGKLVKRIAREKGLAIHSKAVECNCDSHDFVATALVILYAKCGYILEARSVFDKMRQHDIVTWTAMILGYADNGEGEAALDLFARMKLENCAQDSSSFVAALKACADLATKEEKVVGNPVKWKSLQRGYAVHTEATRNHVSPHIYVGSTLVDMYAKCGSMRDAQSIFDNIRNPDVVTWTALILGYADNGEERMALDLFTRMKRQGCPPNSLTFTAALRACGILGVLETGKALHLEICTGGFENDPILASCLVYFYGKCGSMADARQVFELTKAKRTLITWNALMTGYSQLGDTLSVIDLFDKLCDYPNLTPDRVTFVCLISACSHAGLVDSAKDYFGSMSKFGVLPDLDHYACMVDLLGRANKLDDALNIVRRMPFTPDPVTWMTILGACRKWEHEQLGQLAYYTLLSMGIQNAGAFALMSNMERNLQSEC